MSTDTLVSPTPISGEFQVSSPAKPSYRRPDPSAFPPSLLTRHNWCLWSAECRDGKWSKVPRWSQNVSKARSDAEYTWSDWATTLAAFETYNAWDGDHPKIDGIGFMLSLPITGIDLDKCRNKATGEIAPWAQELIDLFDSYTEVSVSGTGIRILIRGQKPQGSKCKKAIDKATGQALEIYDSARFMTLSGHRIGKHSDVQDRQAELEAVCETHLRPEINESSNGTSHAAPNGKEAEILALARKAGNADRFNALWSGDWQSQGYLSQSEADGSLCRTLGFYTGSNEELLDSLFKQSGLHRSKWERLDYRRSQLEFGMSGDGHYKWPEPDQSALIDQIFCPIEPAAQDSDIERATENGKITLPMPSLADLLDFDDANCFADAPIIKKSTPAQIPVVSWNFNDWDADCKIADAQVADWFWEGWGEFGTLGMLTGLPFSGKSLLIGELIAAMATTGQFCGRTVQPCPFILLDYENKEKTIINRIRKALGTNEGKIRELYHRVALSNMPRPITVDWIKQTLGKLKAKLTTTDGKCLIVIDTFRSAYAGGDNDEMNASAMVNLLAPLQGLAKETNSFILVLHHNAKHSDSFSGSTAIAAMTDFMWNWTRNDKDEKAKDKDLAKLRWTGRGDYQESLVFKFDKQQSRNFYVGTAAEQVNQNKNARRESQIYQVIKLLTTDGNAALTKEQLMDAADLKGTATRERLKMAENDSLIESSGSGKKNDPTVYWLTAKGQDLINKMAALTLVGCEC